MPVQVGVNSMYGSPAQQTAQQPPQAAPLNLQAELDPRLLGLLGRQNRYLDALESGGGLQMDIAGQKMRDASIGARQSLQQSEGARGVSSSNRLGKLEADTNRNVTQAIGDVASRREAMLGQAIQGGLGVAAAPGAAALAEKGLGLNAYQAQNAVNSQNFSNFLALLQAQRTSPANQAHGFYTGGVTPVNPGGASNA